MRGQERSGEERKEANLFDRELPNSQKNTDKKRS
jgi:hypothetical protein